MPPIARVRLRPVPAAAVLYALLAVAFVSPALVPGRTLAAGDYLWSAAPWQAAAPAGLRPLGANYERADAATVFEPFLEWTRAQLPSVPLWNPYVGAGRPFVADMQSALFSPFSWPAYVLPFWWSLGVVAALKLWVAAFGGFLLARALAMRWPGALLTGTCFAFGLWFVTWLAWPLASVWAWLPWLLLAVDRAIARPGAGRVVALAVVVALQFFGGHPESSFHVLVAAALFALLRLSRRPRGSRLPAAGRLAAGAVGGVGLAAVVLLPFLELLSHSSDLAERGTRQPVHVAPRYVLGLALPEYWGRPTGTVLAPFINARAWYIGALPLMLSGIALLRPSRERVAVAAAAAVSLAVATGIEPFFAVANHVPGFAEAHNTRLGVFVALGLALLAGWGLEDLRERARGGAWLAAGLTAVVALPVLVAVVRGRVEGAELGEALKVAWRFVTPPGLPAAATVVPMAAVLVWLPLALAGAGLIWARASGRLAVAPFTVAALALVGLDLLRVGVGQNPSIPVANAHQPVTGAIRYLERRRPQRFAGVARAAVVPPLPPNVAMRYGLQDARAYDYPVDERYATLWKREIAKPDPFGLTPAGAVATASPRALRALGLFGVSDLLAPPGDPVLSGLRVAYSGPDARVYANARAVPRAFLVGRRVGVGSAQDALDVVTKPAFDPRTEVVVEGPSGGGSTGRAAVTRLDPDRMTVRTVAAGGSTLVTADVFDPGWKATVDGRAADVERVDYLLRGVRVPAGRHTVEFAYRPWSWTAGWIVSLVFVVGLAAVWKSPRRWRF